MNQVLKNGFIKVVIGCVFLIFCAITCVNLVLDASMEFQTAHFTYTTSLLTINNLIVIIALILILTSFSLNLKKERKWMPYVVLTSITVISCVFIWKMIDPGKPTDSFDVYQAALSWYENGSPIDSYFVNFPYQFGLIHLTYSLISLFHDETIVTLVFRCINLIALIIIGNILLDLTKRITDTSWSYLFILLYGCFFAPFLLVTFIYGDLIGLCFALQAIWVYSNDRIHAYTLRLTISLLCLLIAIYFRLNSSIFGIALAIYALLFQTDIKAKISGFLGFLLITIIGINLGSIILEWICHVETFDIPMVARLAMGLDANGAGSREPGWYNGYIITLLDQYGNNIDQIKQQATIDLWASLQTFFSQPGYAIEFFFRKFASVFVLSDFEGFSMNFISYENTWNFLGMTIDGSYFIFWYNHISRVSLLLICFGATITTISQFKKHTSIPWLLLLTILGGISYHMLFEAKSRYVLPYVLLMIPLSILGYKKVTEKTSSITYLVTHKPLIISVSLFTTLMFSFISFSKTILPTLSFEAYTDTQEHAPLISGNYYRYPIAINSSITLTDVSILTYRDSAISNEGFVQIDIYDAYGTSLATQTISANRLQDESWTTVSFSPIDLKQGDYFIQVSSNNPESQQYGLILGNQYSYINEENMLLNNYEMNLQGNIKIYKNH